MQENDNNSLAEILVNYEMLIEMIPELGRSCLYRYGNVGCSKSGIPGVIRGKSN